MEHIPDSHVICEWSLANCQIVVATPQGGQYISILGGQPEKQYTVCNPGPEYRLKWTKTPFTINI